VFELDVGLVEMAGRLVPEALMVVILVAEERCPLCDGEHHSELGHQPGRLDD
jgi:hypothetical protein